jgi:hypothetical protein
MTHNEVSDASGISIACWYRTVKDPERITIQQLISLANGLHIPIHLFFSCEDTDIIGVREDYILTHNYQNCYYDSDAIRQRIESDKSKSWRKAADAVGMHWTNVAASLLAVSRTPVVRVLTLCETFEFDLFEFLVDPNINSKTSKKQDDDDGLREKIDGLNKKIEQLNNAVLELTDKYKTLLERHNRLENDFCYFTSPRNIDFAADGDDK